MKSIVSPRWIRAGAVALALATSAPFALLPSALAQTEANAAGAHGDELLNAIGQAFEEPPAVSSQPLASANDQDAAHSSAAAESAASAAAVDSAAAAAAMPVERTTMDDRAAAAATLSTEEATAEVATAEQLQAAQGDSAEHEGDSAEKTSGRPRQLSVEPGAVPLYPDDTPAWIHASPDYSSTRHVIPVASLPTADRNTVDEALDEQLLAAMFAYVEERIVGEPGSGDALRNQITVDYIRRNLIDEPLGYTVELQTSTGPMYQKWVQLVISPEQREQLQQWHKERIQRQRLGPIVAVVVVLLGAVGGFHLLVRRPAKQAADELRAGQHRVELPVVNKMPVKAKKTCCKSGAFPIALLVAVPIMIAIVAKRNREQAREAVRVEQRALELRVMADEQSVPVPPEMPAPPRPDSAPSY